MLKRGGKEKKKAVVKPVLQMLWPFFRVYANRFPLFVLGSAFLSALIIIEPILYGKIVDAIITFVDNPQLVGDAFKTISPLLLIWLGVILASSLAYAFYSYSAWWVGNAIVGDFGRELYRRILSFDSAQVENRKAGDLQQRLSSAWDSLFSLIASPLRELIGGGITLVFASIVGFWIDWRMMLVTLAPIPLIVLLGFINAKYARPGQQKVSRLWEKIMGNAHDAFLNNTTVKSFSLEKKSVTSFAVQYLKTFHLQNRINLIWAGTEAGYGFIYTLGRLGIFSVGTYLVIQGSITLGAMITFLGFTSFIFGSVSRIVNTFPELQRDFVKMELCRELFDVVPEIQEKPGAFTLRRANGEVQFENVSFSYKEKVGVLKNVSFHLSLGQTFAIVGESGAGKSTLAKMMLRLQDPTKGAVKIDGFDLRDLTLKSVRSNVGFVMQENLLFHDSILNNIKLAKPNATKAQIVAAAKRAQAHEFISRLPKGYNSTVGERGVKLSGGEKQRIALARVFLEDPPILVLDEATSALDSKTEFALQEALEEVMKNRTTLVIAHRLSTVMRAHKILVMDKGTIVDQGTHKQLIAKGGLYEEYWRIQAGGYEAQELE